jgi:hypothetical protein
MKITFSLPIAFIFSCVYIASPAQSTFKEGFVVTNTGDTIQGWIDYRQWEKNPKAIKFKNELKVDQAKSFAVEDISYFEIPGFDRYVRAIVRKDLRPVELNRLLGFYKDSTITDTVFLRALIKSKISLYQLEDEKAHFYIKDETGEYEELIYKVYLEDDDSRISARYIFRDQLKKWVAGESNNSSLSTLLKVANYNERDLTRIIGKINVLSGNKANYIVKKPKQPVSLYAGTGIVYSSLSFKGAEQPISKLGYSKSLSPIFSAGIDVGALRNLQRMFLRFELAWYSLKYESNNSPSPSTDNISYSLKVSTLAPSVSVMYNLVNSSKHKLYAGTGISYNISGYPENKYTRKYTNSTPDQVQSPYLTLEKNWFSFNAKAGYIMNNKIEFGGSIRFGGTFSNFIFYSLNPSIASLGINYHF